ncbi:AbiH family protein [Acinetobacter faecalis]|uniref:AbiH family protein n=1 Tax=Acinetobacter faecalis TaxID=2665161 RepID=UPI002A909DD5|nr:AbiH family protein [Acinetobacter faecalis]MDY6456285.1 AbiH family protein [Acinetobacter faecalis]
MKLDCKKIINYLNTELENFKCLFSDYINHVVEKLIQNRNIKLENYFETNYVYSFNYTSTFSTIYNKKIKVHYLHGSVKFKNSIVLGISELHDNLLKKYKAYGFVKYHQKLLKNTDYKFVENDRNIHKIRQFWKDVGKEVEGFPEEFLAKNRCNIYIWGHSLDKSDGAYIREIFLLNHDFDANVRLIILYYNDSAKFELLANLLDILGQEIVEKWMKNGWLTFKPNPDIAKINHIKAVDLPKPN